MHNNVYMYYMGEYPITVRKLAEMVWKGETIGYETPTVRTRRTAKAMVVAHLRQYTFADVRSERTRRKTRNVDITD